MPTDKSKPKATVGIAPTGNYVSEWLGHRLFPTVRLDVAPFVGSGFGTCPFLSDALGQKTRCVKNENSFGVCTVNTFSGSSQQDWLACPYRVISSDLVKAACGRIFGIEGKELPRPVPATVLAAAPEREKFKAEVRATGFGYVFFQAKLGGEISVISTPQSPELSFDVTLVEVMPAAHGFKVGRYGIFEIQTMDFHGSYRDAVNNLRDALRLHGRGFPSSLKANIEWAAEGVEGPNIANVFKRTFYQILLKFQLARQGAAAGTVLAIPRSVWNSWQPFLGAPELVKIGKDAYRVKALDAFPSAIESTNAHICIFDLDSTADEPISPVKVQLFIRVDAEELAHHAFKVVPAGMLKSISESDSILIRIKERLASIWPEIA
jgi:hypothetical protein